MRIYRRPGSKVWQVYWKGQRFSSGYTDKPAAEAWFRELQRREADPTYRPPDPSDTVARTLDSFCDRQKERGRAPGTLSMYDLHCAIINEGLGEDTPIALIDAAAIDRFVSWLTKTGASKSYRWKIWCTLRGALKRARKLGKYPFPIDEVTPDDMQPEYVPLTRHLLMPEVTRLLEELEPERRAPVAFIVAFGADLGCLERAQPGDVDTKGRVARIRGSKTVHRDRLVPIVPPFEELAELAAAGIPFVPWPSMRRDLIRAATRAQVGPLEPKYDRTYADGRAVPGRHITARDLRRSHGRILREAGVAPHLIGPMLGHAPGSPVTALTYAQITPAELGEQIRRAGGRKRRAGSK